MLYSGNATPTSFTGSITADVGQAFTVGDATGWPEGGEFPALLDQGLPSAEKVVCTRSANVFTTTQRGVDGTTPYAHTDSPVTHVLLATDILPASGGSMTGRLGLKAYRDTVVPLASSGTLTLDPSAGAYFTTAPTAAVTFVFGADFSNGDSIFLHINGYASGSWSVTWPAGVMWTGGVAPTMSVSKHHFLTFTRIGGENFGLYGGAASP